MKHIPRILNRAFLSPAIIPLFATTCALLSVIGAASIDMEIKNVLIERTIQRAEETTELILDNLENITDGALAELELVNARLGDQDDASAIFRTITDFVLPDTTLQISVVDRRGFAIATNLSSQIDVDLSDRKHVRVQLNRTVDGIYMSVPVVGRISGKKSIQFSKRFEDSQGNIRRILVSSFAYDTLLGHLSALSLGPRSQIIIAGRDGIARFILERDDKDRLFISFGQDIAETAYFRASMRSEFGSIDGHGEADEIDRLIGFRVSPKYDLRVFVGLDRDNAEAQYRPFRARLVGIELILSATIVVLGIIGYLIREQQLTQKAVAAARIKDSLILRRLSEINGISIGVVSKDGSLSPYEPDNNSHLSHSPTRDMLASIWPTLSNSLFGANQSNVRHQGINGQWHEIAILANPAHDRGGSHFTQNVVLAVDQTDFRRNSNRLYHLSKLAAIGELAASTAHEMVQPLSTIWFAIYNLRKLLDCGDLSGAQSKFDIIERQVARLRNRTDHLLRMGRKDDGISQAVKINDIIESSLELFETQFRLDNIKVVKDPLDFRYDRSLICVPNEIEQVVINLLQNARDAIKRGAAIDRAGLIRLESKAEHDRLVIAVSDNGGGIIPDAFPHIFEPFFTTKLAGSGTGLGLTISLDIVRSYGGWIEAKNIDDGARFELHLPTKDSF